LAVIVGQNSSADDGREQTAFTIEEATILQLQSALANKKITSLELVDHYLQRIERFDQQGPSINAISNINSAARDAAQALDAERVDTGARGPLHGIPIVLKDNYETVELPTTSGSILFANWNSGQDAFLVQRLRAAGAIILATTNMHEFAMGVDTVGSLFGQTRNPYGLDRIPGGSSGGSAAAVASNFAVIGMGSDTCGSLRIPAAFNSLVSLRGTQGLASRSGIVPLAPTQDIAGPIARTVSDVAIVFEVIAGYDPADMQTALSKGKVSSDYRQYLRTDGLRDARIGLLSELVSQSDEDDEVAEIIVKAAADMKKLGAIVFEIDIPDLRDYQGTYLSRMEFKFAMNDYLSSHPDAPVATVHDIVDSGKYHAAMELRLRGAQSAVSLEDESYLQQLALRKRLNEAIVRTMDDRNIDAIMYPTMRRKAALIGQSQGGNNCFLSARSGLPAITVPAGFTADGIPVGVELLGRTWDESTLFRLAYSFEQATLHRRPPGSTHSR
jgi:Asp-tRNA(Asn)/Glu-tRNA(Gln) amidotransferase A subunit family amidase